MINTSLTPTTERISSLDFLRGFAILGILFMNIQSFSMIGSAYFNPTAFGDFTGLNKLVWYLSHIFADQKFISIFSILFGAGIILFSKRIEDKGSKPSPIHYRRTFWLLVIGLMHAYLLWYGDILVGYAVCAFFIYLFRNLQAKTLFIWGSIFVLVSPLLYLIFQSSIPFWPPEAIQETIKAWAPTPEQFQIELDTYRGGWIDQLGLRIPTAIGLQTFIFLIWTVWRAGGLMLIGMALFKSKVLSAEKSNSFYTKLMVYGFIIGFLFIIVGLVLNNNHNWAWDFSFFLGSQFNYLGSVGVALGYIGLLMLISKLDVIKYIKASLSAVGKMALTNYLLQTVLCTSIFYGHGFGLYGSVERIYQFLIVVIILAIQIIVSPIWLQHFKFGPAEWLWRSLTYWKLQPMRLNNN